jgi:hypothetical protein
MINRIDDAPGPAGRWLMHFFLQHAAELATLPENTTPAK